jgi:hypothetical protein
MIVLSSVSRDKELGTVKNVMVYVVGLLDMESMTNALCTVVRTRGVILLLLDLSFCVMVVHPSLSYFPLSSSPVYH